MKFHQINRVGLILCTISFASCSVSLDIQMHSDGTASVEQYYSKTTDKRSFDYYAESPNVVELNTSEASIPPDFAEMTLKVDPIDSLGSYLTDFRPGFLTFTKEQNQVIISLSGTEPFFWNINQRVFMRLEFEQDISSIVSDDIKVKRDGENAIEMNRTGRQLKNKGQPTEIKVTLEDQ